MSNFFGLTDAAHRNHLFDLVRVDFLSHIAADKTGGDGIDGDIPFGYFLGEGTCSCNHGAFSSGIVELAGHTLKPRRGCNVDNSTGPLAQHLLNHVWSNIDHSFPRDAQTVAPLFFGPPLT